MVASLVGHLALIFAGKAIRTGTPNSLEKSFYFKTASADSNQIGWAIYSTNWEYFFKGFTGLEAHANNQIQKIAFTQVLRKGISHKEYLFWRAIYEGCKVVSE